MAPSPNSLPPFSGDDPQCAKCANAGAFTEYKAKGEPRSGDFLGANNPERLERRCTRCGFIWDEALNPTVQGGA